MSRGTGVIVFGDDGQQYIQVPGGTRQLLQTVTELSVRDPKYGINADGVTDNTAGLAALFADAQQGDTIDLRMSGGIAYRTKIDWSSKSDLTILGSGDAGNTAPSTGGFLKYTGSAISGDAAFKVGIAP